jgi:hypothetical protein
MPNRSPGFAFRKIVMPTWYKLAQERSVSKDLLREFLQDHPWSDVSFKGLEDGLIPPRIEPDQNDFESLQKSNDEAAEIRLQYKSQPRQSVPIDQTESPWDAIEDLKRDKISNNMIKIMELIKAPDGADWKALNTLGIKKNELIYTLEHLLTLKKISVDPVTQKWIAKAPPEKPIVKTPESPKPKTKPKKQPDFKQIDPQPPVSPQWA